MNIFVHSLTWVMLPELELMSRIFMVCIESIITISGRVAVMVLHTDSASVMLSRYRLVVTTPNLSALSFTWRTLSSPET